MCSSVDGEFFCRMLFVMKLLVVVVFLVVSGNCENMRTDLMELSTEEDFLVPRIVTRVGYEAEIHHVQTEDGYLLELHRIVSNEQNYIDNSTNRNRPVVLVMHGLLALSECWLLNGKNRSLGYLLADNGYDVWLGNARGTRHSRKHVTMDADRDKKFWQFSWHEIGYYDLPAKIDYILNYTSQPSLYYIGHSQGTTTFYVMASERPEYNKKIRLMVSLAPVAFMSHLASPAIRLLAKFRALVEWILKTFGIIEIPSSGILLKMNRFLCGSSDALKEICSNVIFAVSGYDSEQFDRKILPIIVSIMPGGASIKQIAHYGQEIVSGYFRHFDHGMLNNIRKYGRFTPPSYDLKKITAPVALFYAPNDWLSAVADVHQLGKQLPNVVKWRLVAYEKFAHVDFMWAKDGRKLVYDEMMELMRKF